MREFVKDVFMFLRILGITLMVIGAIVNLLSLIMTVLNKDWLAFVMFFILTSCTILGGVVNLRLLIESLKEDFK